MARPLLNLSSSMYKFPSLSSPIFLLVSLATVFSLFSIVTFLCTSHNSKRSHRRDKESSNLGPNDDKKLLSKLSSNINEKAHVMVKMISWRKVQAGEEDDGNSEEALWRRTVMLGERCRPLDFSGKIEYDSEGNLLTEPSSLRTIAPSRKF
ncbi:hypothetical protein K2173_001406 [Erythroxylum novogranatense]|uniref:Transmembrane protein n=1 Tax=Erythroxylum novogranatense TaxID=1862640 RepID=A0AAV8T3L6_9ROSI|nr:hypothetical protein K2173_001406 [Erythroxylum novogranatense]